MSLVHRSNLFDIDRFFHGSLPQPARASASNIFAPRVDIADGGDHYEITAELPGVHKSDIQVSVEEGVLTLEAVSKKAERKDEDGKTIRQERRYGKFVRRFSLGAEVSEENIQASFENGVLTLQAPKLVEKALERRQIDIH